MRNGRSCKSHGADGDALTANPDLAGIFVDNESSSAGTVQAVKARENHRVKIVAFDASNQLISGPEGRLDRFAAGPEPAQGGYESVKTLALKLRCGHFQIFSSTRIRLRSNGAGASL